MFFTGSSGTNMGNVLSRTAPSFVSCVNAPLKSDSAYAIPIKWNAFSV